MTIEGYLGKSGAAGWHHSMLAPSASPRRRFILALPRRRRATVAILYRRHFNGA